MVQRKLRLPGAAVAVIAMAFHGARATVLQALFDWEHGERAVTIAHVRAFAASRALLLRERAALSLISFVLTLVRRGRIEALQKLR